MITSTGKYTEKSDTTSKLGPADAAARNLSTVSDTMSCHALIARGVNTLFTRLRMTRCSGGSIEMIILAGAFCPVRTIPRSTPYADE